MFSSYFEKIAGYSSARFILEITALGFLSRFLIVLPVLIILTGFGVNVGEANITKLDLENQFWHTQFLALFLAPLLETIIFQFLPLKILKFLKVPLAIALVIATLLFAYAHLEDGLINFIGMVPIGFLFAWSFAVKQKQSTIKAIITVFIIHSLTNLLATVMYLIGR